MLMFSHDSVCPIYCRLTKYLTKVQQTTKVIVPNQNDLKLLEATKKISEVT